MSGQNETMNLETFNENYDLTRSGRAVPKGSAALAPVASYKTADGEIFDREKNYFYFDENKPAVRESLGLVPSGEYLTGANGFRIVLISRLRLSKDSALSDGQEFFKTEVKRFSELIAKFELEKGSKNRSLKDYLMANNAAK